MASNCFTYWNRIIDRVVVGMNFLFLVMSESEDFFFELFFGMGGVLGFLLVCSLLFLISAKIKYVGIFTPVVAFVLGLSYINNLASNSNLWWLAILSFLMIPFLLITSFAKGKDAI